MSILVIGLNHDTAPVEIREKVTFPGDSEGHSTRFFSGLDGVEEVMILSTCNRAEVFVVADDAKARKEMIVQGIGQVHGIDPEPLRDFLYIKTEAEAVRHVFRVASSLDSMVIGEPQILGQVKESFRRAAKVNATGPILNRLLHRAFFSAKRVRTETEIGSAAVSVAYVAVELARKILGDLVDKAVLLIGAGEMAELAARHLIAQVTRPIVVVNRTFENACSLAGDLRGLALRMEKLEDGLIDADVAITSTGSCEPLITKDRMNRVMRKRRYRPIFIIDIAIPRDVEPQVNDIDGVYLYNIDDLQAVVSENLGERKQEALKGERIVEEEVGKFMNWKSSLSCTPTIIALRDKLETIRTGELTRMNGKLSRLSPAEREIVELISKSIINKVAHDPILFLKKAGGRTRKSFYLDTAQRMFGLDANQLEQHHHTEESPIEEEIDDRYQG